MALSIADIIGLKNPTVAALTDLSDRIELAEMALDERTFGDRYNEAVALAVLHHYEVTTRGGVGGAITSEKEGQLSRSFGATASSSAWSSTSWGQELEHLVKSLNVFPRNRMMSWPSL